MAEKGLARWTAERWRIPVTYCTVARTVVSSDWWTGHAVRLGPMVLVDSCGCAAPHVLPVSQRSLLIRLILSVMYRLLMNAYTTVLRPVTQQTEMSCRTDEKWLSSSSTSDSAPCCQMHDIRPQYVEGKYFYATLSLSSYSYSKVETVSCSHQTNNCEINQRATTSSTLL